MAVLSVRVVFLTLLVTVLFCFSHVSATTNHARRDAGTEVKKKREKAPAEPQYSEEETYFNYITRPDLRPVRWEIQNIDKSALAPGYWFVAPYAKLEQEEYNSWNGPQIFDQDGELIWSGSPMFNHLNIYDFRLAQVNDRMLPTLIFTEHADGLILDEAYTISQTVDMFGGELPDWLMAQMGGEQHTTNMHDFNVIDNGKRAVMLTKVFDNATREESKTVGFDGECTAKWQGFKEVDVATSEVLYEWSAHGHIDLRESTYYPDSLDKMCNGNAGPTGWDILHLNSIDKFPDGDYLLSARHTNTLYKISHTDGAIVWRLTAENGDFEFLDDDAKFRRQHHARVVSQNATHTVITLFNNARGFGKGETPLGDLSTGLQLALRTDTAPMTAEVVAKYERPDGRYTVARGSVQLLDNGNAFVSWSKYSLQSEHAPDGRLLMQAQFRDEAANTYRAYKYPWVGRPTQAPDVHAAAVERKGDILHTVVHVSWNGATEVAAWNLYKTNARGEARELIGSTLKQGFESMVSYKGYASHVVVEGVDAEGRVLGTSRMVQSLPPANLVSPAIVDEAQWLQDHSVTPSASVEWGSVLEIPIVTYGLGFVSCGVTVLIVALLWRARRGGGVRASWLQGKLGSYERVQEEDMEDNDFSEDTIVEEMSDRMGLSKEEV